jgi:hypothetical protein
MLGFAQSRVVHASPGTATRRQSCNSSYTPSTRGRGISCRQYILSRIEIAIVNRSAACTYPLTVAKSQRIVKGTALATFAGRLEAVRDTQLASVPSALVLKHLTELSESGVTDSLGQAPILEHAAHVEILEGNRAEPANQIGRNFIEVILTRVSYLNVQPSDFHSLTVAASAAFLSATQHTLSVSEFTQAFCQRFKRLNFLACRQASQRFQPQVNTDRGCILGQHIPRLFYRLVKAKAGAIWKEYESDGTISALSFRIQTEFGILAFRLPANIQRVYQVVVRDGRIPRSQRTREQAARLAWRIVKDWTEAQLAMIEVGLVDLTQVFLPYMQAPSGETLYELMRKQKFQPMLSAPKGSERETG